MYGHLFSTDLLDGFSQDFLEDEFHVPIDTFDDPDYRNALMKVPHGGVCIGAIKPQCVSHRGERYGKLTVLCDHLREGSSKSRKVHCRCECGNEKDIDLKALTSGCTVSCGCRKAYLNDSVRRAQAKEQSFAERREKLEIQMQNTDPKAGDMCKTLRCLGSSFMCGKFRFVPAVCESCGKKSWYVKSGWMRHHDTCSCKNGVRGKGELWADSYGLTQLEVEEFMSKHPYPDGDCNDQA